MHLFEQFFKAAEERKNKPKKLRHSCVIKSVKNPKSKVLSMPPSRTVRSADLPKVSIFFC